MKIDSSIKPSAGASVASARNRGPEPAAASGKSAAAADVRLSSLAAQIQGSGEGAPVDAARIAEIKQAISEGRFAINAGAIADRLIDTAKELIGAQRRA